MNHADFLKLRREMTAETAKISEARELYPDAPEAELFRIAEGAQVLAEVSESAGREESTPYGAAQTEYGCDWQWGNGTMTRDEWGRIVPEEDAQPTARVYDCDGNTIAQLI